MNMERKAVTRGFVLLWLLLALAGTALAVAVLFAVLMGLGEVGGPISVFLVSIIMTITFGTYIALAQWTVLRRFLPRSAVWIGATLLGFLVCCPAVLSLSGNFSPMIPTVGSLNLTLAWGAVLGVAQWLAIAKRVRWGAAWIGVSLVSWFLGGLVALGLKALSWQSGSILYWVGLLFGGALLSAAGILWLFRLGGEAKVEQPETSSEPLWRRILRLPSTSPGWCSVILAAIYIVLIIALRTLSGRVAWGAAGILTISVVMQLLLWAAGIAALVAVTEKRERSAIVWIAMIPSVSALINILHVAARDFLSL